MTEDMMVKEKKAREYQRAPLCCIFVRVLYLRQPVLPIYQFLNDAEVICVSHILQGHTES